MKTHHAALALLGWYLLIPPIQLAPQSQQPALPTPFNCVSGQPKTPDGKPCPNTTEKYITQLMDKGVWILRPAHLNEWETYSVFDSAPLCDQAQRTYTDEANKLLKEKEYRAGFKAAKMVSMTYARCISSDDPRLAK